MSWKQEKIQWKSQLINLVSIFIGVYLAFYLTEKSSEANNRKLANAYLATMADDLESDIRDLEISTDTLKYMVKVSQALTQSIAKQRIVKDSLHDMINSLYLIVPFNPKDNSYQSLLATGKLNAIDNFELRKKITELYHEHYGSIKIADEIISQQRINVISPYLMKNMRYNKFGLINADELWKDNMFGNLAYSMHYSNILKYQMDSSALEKAKDLRSLILSDLD